VLAVRDPKSSASYFVVVVVSSLPIPLPQTSVNYIPKASVLELVAAITFIGIFNAPNNRL